MKSEAYGGSGILIFGISRWFCWKTWESRKKTGGKCSGWIWGLLTSVVSIDDFSGHSDEGARLSKASQFFGRRSCFNMTRHAYPPTLNNHTALFSYYMNSLAKAFSTVSPLRYLQYLAQFEQPGSLLSHFLFLCLQAAHAWDAVLDDGRVAKDRIVT